MKKTMMLFLFFIPALPTILVSQDLSGLWLVEKVQVGQEEMTPVAKWFQLYATGLLRAGNGGNTNLTGSWQLDHEGELIMLDKNGKPDEAGPFDITLANDKNMTWTRTEEDQIVVVHLTQTSPEEWPAAPWDKIQGQWTVSASEGMDLLPDSVIFERLYFRWDHLVNINFGTPHPRRRSIWRIPAHQSILQLLPEDENLPRSTWQIAFTGNHMTWTQTIGDQTVKIEWEQTP